MSFDMRQILLTGVDGSTWDLTSGNSGVVAQPDSRLWGSTSLEVATVRTIGSAGARVVGVEYPPRDLALPVHLVADIGSALDETAHQFAKAINGANGDFTITVVRGDGVSRSIDVIVMDGFDALDLTTCYAANMPAVLSLRAHNPFWYATNSPDVEFDPPRAIWDSASAVDWSANDVGWSDNSTLWSGILSATGAPWSARSVAWSAPNLPWNGDNYDYVRQTLPNDGDVEAWPVWTVTGACQVAYAINRESGEAWRLLTGLADGQTMTINTETGVVRIDGELAMPRLDARDMWSIPSGGCTVGAMHTQRGTNATLSASYKIRYLTP